MMEPPDSQLERGDVTTEDSSQDSSEIESSVKGSSHLPERPAGPGNQATATGGKSAGLFPDLNTVDWYLDPRFQRYWKHYHQVMNWYHKHLETYQMLTSRLSPGSATQSHSIKPNVSRFNPYASFHRSAISQRPRLPLETTYPTWTSINTQSQQVNTGTPHHTKSSSYTSRDTASSGLESSSCLEGAESKLATAINPEQFEMEITDEMVEFFAQSRKHKKERDDAKKLSDVENSGDVYVDAEKTNRKTATTQAPTERPGARRTQEMKLLYGKGAAMIHGMETAMQMTFDRNTDILQPKLWPNMPLKIVFFMKLISELFTLNFRGFTVSVGYCVSCKCNLKQTHFSSA
ncbi:gem-associated protein 8-like [Liolophura sinensis]|uniref:gem-associated protein 8-like n=1 Tax=Liolophura sinensis TaxID=3198878 RepID=UPI003159264B